MAKDLFSNLDLNLLRTFIILHQERNMRKAAERLFVSQPAVSKALQRLRAHFGDELFVKTHTGLRATEYSNKLADNVSPLIDELSTAINASNEFDPNELTGTLKVALAPFILSSFASEIFGAIRSQAPNVQVHLLNWSKSTMQELINDEVQLGVNYEIGHAPKELISKKVAQDSFSAYIRKDHPFKGDAIALDSSMDFELATIIAADWNSNQSFAEKLLNMRGVEHKIAFRSELPSAVIDVVLNTDMMFPGSSLTNIEKLDKLRRLPILLDNVALTPNVYAYYHHKNRQNETMLWLRRIVEDTITG
ncbi:LysR family transcriptional regulator [Vibrio sp. RE86]|uniref:LysR family transcriptional regulator n=1 Tax=Vibrio sp. RE86 TaxID=2607605 RepID=UPI001493B586|nr:LysR family transcriptional regulator [Vibrio sp. RE86]NOH78276.1 LysR family transcriptional regulator [Vibrio sp. RE86]